MSDIIKVISFNAENSDKTLLKAINHFHKADGKIDFNAPQDFFDSDEKSQSQEKTEHLERHYIKYYYLFILLMALNLESLILNIRIDILLSKII